MQIHNPKAEDDVMEWLESEISELYDVIIRDTEPSQYIGLTIASKCFEAGDLWLSFRPISQLEHEDLWELIDSAVQSNNDFVVD